MYSTQQSGPQKNFDYALEDGHLTESEQIYLSSGPGRFDAAYHATSTSGFHGSVPEGTGDRPTLFVGTSAKDTVRGDHGDEVFKTLGGDDTIIIDGGMDWVYAGDGADTLEINKAWADFEITYRDGTYYLVERGESITDRDAVVACDVEFYDFSNGGLEAGNLLNVDPTDIRFAD